MAWRALTGRKPEIAHSLDLHTSLGPTLTVTFRPGEDGYVVAECLQLQGCMSQGKDRPEALKNIVDAIESILAVRLEQFLAESCHYPTNLVGIEAQQTFRVKPVELEPVGA